MRGTGSKLLLEMTGSNLLLLATGCWLTILREGREEEREGERNNRKTGREGYGKVFLVPKERGKRERAVGCGLCICCGEKAEDDGKM